MTRWFLDHEIFRLRTLNLSVSISLHYAAPG
jgi:hypothetical protein